MHKRSVNFLGTRGRKTTNEGPKHMKNSSKTSGIRVKSAVKAGGLGSGNHNAGIRVKSAVKAGGLGSGNHNVSVVRAR